MKKEDLNPPAIVKTAISLEEELAQKIKEREQKIVATTLEHARLQGADLLRVKQHLGGRKFKPWLEAKCGFSRTTAYTYMKVASKWDAICQNALQMASLQEVVRKLFRKDKAKKKSKHGSVPKKDPKDSRQVEEPITDSVSGEKIEAPSNSERVENPEPDQDQLTPEQEQKEKPDGRSHEVAAAEDEDKPIKETPNKSRPNHWQENGEGAASDCKNTLVIPILDPRIHDYFQGMIDELLEACPKRGFFERIHPEKIRDVVKKEGPLVKIILEQMRFAVDRERRT